MTSADTWQETTCDGCGTPFVSEAEYADRCTPHKESCPGEGCDCDLNYHAGCCPECAAEWGMVIPYAFDDAPTGL